MIDLIDLYIDNNHYLRDDIYNNLWTTSENNQTNLATEQFYYITGESTDRFQLNLLNNSFDDGGTYKRGWIYLKNSNIPFHGSQYLDRFEFTLKTRIFPLQSGILLYAGYDHSNPLDYCFYLYVDEMTSTSFNLRICSKDENHMATLNCTSLSLIYPNAYPWMHIKVIGDGHKIALSIIEYPQYGEASIPFSLYNLANSINLGQTPSDREAAGCAFRCDFLTLSGSYYTSNILKVY